MTRLYIIKSGTSYVINHVTLEMTANAGKATKYNIHEANRVQRQMRQAGVIAVKVRWDANQKPTKNA